MHYEELSLILRRRKVLAATVQPDHLPRVRYAYDRSEIV